MNNYSRLVIDLYKEAFTSENYRVNSERLKEVRLAIANAITEARVLNMPTNDLEALQKDIEYLYLQ